MASKLDRLQKKGFKVNEAALSKIARGDQEPGGEYSEININDIEENPDNALYRELDTEEDIALLADDIRRAGLLHNLVVFPKTGVGGKYVLLSGERRLRAARMAGLSEVPCIVMELDLEEASFIALVENLQRNDLDFLEESRGIAQLIRLFGLSQEECARRLGKSQSAVANKLRLLRLPEDVLNAMRNAGLTERHGRALLRLETPAEQRAALAYILSRDLNVAATDAYIERLLEAKTAPESEQQKTFILKDVRVFLNTISHSLDLMKQGGIDAGMHRQETDEALILTINIPKARRREPAPKQGEPVPVG